MSISARELNRSTLGRQLLLQRERLDVGDAVRRVVALQAQQAASPYLALWNRLTDLDPADVDAAFAGATVVKATLMRMTLHAVHADDYPVFRAAIGPTLRATRLGRFMPTGLTLDDADALVPDLLEFADQPRTADELEAWFDTRLGAPSRPAVWRTLRSYTRLPPLRPLVDRTAQRRGSRAPGVMRWRGHPQPAGRHTDALIFRGLTYRPGPRSARRPTHTCSSAR